MSCTKHLSPHFAHPPHVFFPVFTFFFEILLLVSYIKGLTALPGSFFSVLDQAERSPVHNSQHKTHKMPNELNLPLELTSGPQHHFSSSSRSWCWEKLVPTSPSEIPELAGYIGQLWFDVLHHPLDKPQSKVMQVMKSNRLFFFFF